MLGNGLISIFIAQQFFVTISAFKVACKVAVVDVKQPSSF